MQEPSFKDVFEKFLGQSMTADEIRLLYDYVQDNKNDPLLDRLLEAAYTNKSFSETGDHDIDEAFFEVLARARKRTGAGATPVIPFYRKHWLRGIAAAVVITVLAYAGFRLANQGTPQSPPKVAEAAQTLVPGGNKAILTLANGARIPLNQTANGAISRQNGALVTKLDSGTLAYTEKPSGDVLPTYNTVTTPRGGQYQVTLSDGTSVWLNAASSMRFPTFFKGRDRKVEITGEAYFEVATDKDKPFKVSVGNTEITVLGTHFNIMAYSDAPAIKTTLLQGSVAVSQGKERALLAPGQQAVIKRGGDVISITHPDLDEETAWKNGLFIFHNTDIKTVMSQLANWYDADISFKGNVNAHLNGMIPRSTELAKVLSMLELTGETHFTIDKKTIVVQP